MATDFLKPAPVSRSPATLRWVARIAGGTSLLAALILLAVVFWIGDSGGASYFDVVRAHVLTHRQLGPALLVGGLILLVLVAAITWLVALYGSFRFAGPLYRFTRNLREASRQPPMGIRQDDALQETARQLRQAWENLYRLRREIAQTAAAAEAALSAGDAAEWTSRIRRLQALIHRVRLDD